MRLKPMQRLAELAIVTRNGLDNSAALGIAPR